MHMRFSIHAIRRMFQRQISTDDIRDVVEHGIIIEEYPTDAPWPSRLICHFCAGRPIHVVAAWDVEQQEEVIITVYEPNPLGWSPDFMRRV